MTATEIEPQRETLEVLADPDAMRTLHDQDYNEGFGLKDIQQLIAERIKREGHPGFGDK